MPNISNKIKKRGVELEKSALDKFGAAVEDKSKLSFGQTTRATPQNADDAGSGVWESSDYAAQLVKTNTVAFNPKLKFLFKVSFKFSPAMINAADAWGYSLKELQENFTFLVRHVDRPKHDFDYEEVNMYNFRTKVLKSIRNREVTLTVFDDVGNNALSFVNLYRKLLQPITRYQQMPGKAHEDYGFDFGSPEDTSFRAVLPGGAKTIFEEMTIHQIFVERGSDIGNPSAWVKVVNFVFMNPKFTNIDIDDLDHENGANFNIITFSVDFDAVYMDEPRSFTGETSGPSYPGGDIPANGSGGSSAQGGGGSNRSAEPISQTRRRDSAQGGARSVNDTIKVDGPLQEAAGSKSVRGMMSGGNQSIARPSSDVLTDNSVSPSTARSLTRTSSDGNFDSRNLSDDRWNGNDNFNDRGSDSFNDVGSDSFNDRGSDSFNDSGSDSFNDRGSDDFNDNGNDDFNDVGGGTGGNW